MRYYGVDHIDGLLADLGVSSHHFDDESRGFSFRFDAPLDMRMNSATAQRRPSGEHIRRGAPGRHILPVRRTEKLEKDSRCAGEGARCTQDRDHTRLYWRRGNLFRREREKKDMAKLFQALRIEVNNEMTALKEMLRSATELLRPGGRLSVITYHSLEDRIVKNVMKTGNPEGKMKQDFFGRIETPFTLINNKVITRTTRSWQTTREAEVQNLE